jgi:integrase
MHKELAMAGRQAKVITPGMLRRMLGYVRRSRYPRRNRVIVLLGVKAGLRSCEIAGLEWSMVLDGQGSVGWSLNVWDAIAKKRSGCRIPIHPQLRRALIELSEETGRFGPIIRSERGGEMTPNSFHHQGGSQSRSDRRELARCATPRWPSLDRDDAALHRW